MTMTPKQAADLVSAHSSGLLATALLSRGAFDHADWAQLNDDSSY